MSVSKSTAAKRLLAKQRQMTSLIDQEIVSDGRDFVFDKTDWVPLYFDKGYAVRSDCGKVIAYRAVTLDLQLLWLVFGEGKQRGYHAIEADPVAATHAAKATWARRAFVRSNWSEVEQVAQDLILGRARFDILWEDAVASPLCSLGIEGFIRSIGMPRVRRMNGRLAACLMKIEPQMGFVIYEAMQRRANAGQHVSGGAIAAQ